MSVSVKWCNKEWQSCAGGRTITHLKDGCVYTDNLSEELDSATIVLENMEKTDFEPFDLIELTFPLIGTRTMVINDFVENEINLGSGIYTYTINLASKTKELERITLPNISITKPKNGTAQNINSVIPHLLDDYSPKVILNGTYQKIYDYYSDFVSHSILCPDLQMSKPTLRSAIDRVLAIDNCICYLDVNNHIRPLNLNKKLNPITIDDYYNYSPENQSGNDYATETENNYNNVVPNEITGIDEVTKHTEYIGFRTEEMLVDDSNAVVIVNNPIYDLKQVLVCGIFVRFGTDSSINVTVNNVTKDVILIDYDPNDNIPGEFYYEFDIKPYIVELQDYNILSYETKKRRAYYSRGNNKIEGLLNYKKTKLENYVTLQEILNGILDDNNYLLIGYYDENGIFRYSKTSQVFYAIDRAFGGDGSGSVVNPEDIIINQLNNIDIVNMGTGRVLNLDYKRELMFKVVYEAQNDNVRMKSGKYLPERNQNNNIIDNPDEAYVDIKRQGELFNQKCNRLGNRAKELHARFPLDYQNLPQLGDYIGEYVLIHRELSFYDNYILFKGILTENYVNINYFTGINARKRTWNIVSAGEAFDKQLLDKWFLEFSKTRKNRVTGESDYSMISSNFLPFIFYATWEYSSPIVKHAHFSNTYSDVHVELDLTKYITGNSILFHCEAIDNYSLGITINQEHSLEPDPEAPDSDNKKRIVEKYCKYVDTNGNMTNCYIDLYKAVPAGYGYLDSPLSKFGQKISDSLLDDYRALSEYKPRIYIPNVNDLNSNYGIYGYQFQNHKDSREKLGFNIQFELCSDDKDIIIGEGFLDYCLYISNKRTSLKITFDLNKEYKITNKKLISKYYNESANFTIGADGTCYVSFTPDSGIWADENPNSFKSCAIFDSSNDKLIIAFNNLKFYKSGDSYVNSTSIYLNMLRTRDRNNYSTVDLKNWIKL